MRRAVDRPSSLWTRSWDVLVEPALRVPCDFGSDVEERAALILLRLRRSFLLLRLAPGGLLAGFDVEQGATRCRRLRVDLRVGFGLSGRRLRLGRGPGDVEQGAAVGDGLGIGSALDGTRRSLGR